MNYTEHARVLTHEISELERRLSIERDKLKGELSSALENDVIVNVASLNQRLLNKESELSSTRLAASAAASSAPTTHGKRQLPAPAFVPAPSSHVHLSLLVRSSRAPVVPLPCSVHSNLLCASGCVSSCVRADSASRLGERDCGPARELLLWHVRVCLSSVFVCV